MSADNDTDQIRDRLTKDGQNTKHVSRRKWREWRFRMYTFAALLVAAGFVTFFLYDLITRGYSALWQAEVRTTITYTPETVREPKTAFPEEVRPIVSPAVVRKIRQQGQTPAVRLPVHYDRATVEHPEKGIQSVTLEKDEFPIYMDRGPVTIPRSHLLEMIGTEAIRRIRERLRTQESLERREESLAGSMALQQYMISMDDHPLPKELKASVENMIKTNRVSMTFNHEKFGDGKTIEKWVVLDSDVDQYVKGHYSQVGYRADVYRRVMDKMGREPVANPDFDRLMDTIEDGGGEAADRQKKEKNRSTRNKKSVYGGTSKRKSTDQEELEVSSKSRLKELAGSWASVQIIDRMREEGRIALSFNDYFFLNTDSSENPEVAGMKSAVMGSVLVLLVVLVTAVPIGVMTSVYLEEFAPDNWLIQIIEININNLAAIPSILYGLLGLAVFVNMAGLPRSAVIVGGLTLALMTLPIVIISSRSALRSVPDSIRMAGFSMGATRWEVVLHHVLPESLTGILTGSIIGIAQAMGETAPLIIVGMIGFFPNTPTSLFDKSTVMPGIIFKWWSLPHRAFESRAALAILLLLCVLFVLNGFAVVLRARTQETGA